MKRVLVKLWNRETRFVWKVTKSEALRRIATAQSGMQEQMMPMVCSRMLFEKSDGFLEYPSSLHGILIRGIPDKHQNPGRVAIIMVLITKIE